MGETAFSTEANGMEAAQQYVEARYAKQLTSGERRFIILKLAIDERGRIRFGGFLSVLFVALHVSLLFAVIALVMNPSLPQLVSMVLAATILFYMYRKSKKAMLLLRIVSFWSAVWSAYHFHVITQILNSGLLPQHIYESTRLGRLTHGTSVVFAVMLLLYLFFSRRARFTLLEP